MKFSEYKYERPDLSGFKVRFQTTLDSFKKAATAEEQAELVQSINNLRVEFDSMGSICSIRHSVNTNDKFYEDENHFYDEHYPEISELINSYYRALLLSPFKAELEKVYGKQLFILAELNLKTFEPEILADLKDENKLGTAYNQLKARAKIEFRGKSYNLSSINPLELDTDRATRKESQEAKWGFFEQNATEVEGIFDKMVKLRQSMAEKLGYKNYIPLGYARMRRSDYGPEEVAVFRQQILDHIVPIATELYARQAKRIGLEKLEFYDISLGFPSGNPTPKGQAPWMEEQAAKMYAELSKETDEFYRYMWDHDLMDLSAKDGKMTGGYCTFIGKYQSPFIFSNFNGTSHDVTVLTHEAGHAFQCYATSRNQKLYEYLWPTYEACEIHSMSMEFFTWPWMQLFFKEDTEKFKYEHLTAAIQFLPYGVAIDEFQHVIYENPDMSTAERNAAWRAIERKYMPHRTYEGNEFLENGGFWQRQSHIFNSPFYYIDYVLAQICAFQFWKRSLEDKEAAWKDYVNLCKAGGSVSFLKLVELAGLRSPFDEGTVAWAIQPIKDYFEKTDDSKF
jgi:M3 family oligoendopeptidase